jgi:hypothetical protein
MAEVENQLSDPGLIDTHMGKIAGDVTGNLDAFLARFELEEGHEQDDFTNLRTHYTSLSDKKQFKVMYGCATPDTLSIQSHARLCNAPELPFNRFPDHEDIWTRSEGTWSLHTKFEIPCHERIPIPETDRCSCEPSPKSRFTPSLDSKPPPKLPGILGSLCALLSSSPGPDSQAEGKTDKSSLSAGSKE